MVNEVMTNVARISSAEVVVCLANGIGKHGSSYGRAWNWAVIIYHTQKLSQNGLKNWK